MSKEAAQSSKSCAFHSCEMFSWDSSIESIETDPLERPTAMDVEDEFQSMHKHMEELMHLLYTSFNELPVFRRFHQRGVQLRVHMIVMEGDEETVHRSKIAAIM